MFLINVNSVSILKPSLLFFLVLICVIYNLYISFHFIILLLFLLLFLDLIHSSIKLDTDLLKHLLCVPSSILDNHPYFLLLIHIAYWENLFEVSARFELNEDARLVIVGLRERGVFRLC